jgi:protein involved in polysaccharide export with SLBB domain
MHTKALMRLAFPLLIALGLVACATDQAAVIEATDAERVTVLGPSDLIEIRVYGEPELSGAHQISPEGTVRLALIGDIDVDGQTPDDAQRIIEQAYNEKYLKNAQVSLLVKKYNSRRIYVLGQVKSPGNYEFDERMTVIAAIAKAGGTTRLSDGNRAILTRGKGAEQKRMSISVTDIERGRASDVELLPGDIVYVPESMF